MQSDAIKQKDIENATHRIPGKLRSIRGFLKEFSDFCDSLVGYYAFGSVQ
jgi:hypothetical protein